MSKETRDRIAFRMQPETRRRIEQWYAADNCQSKNEFIEKAVNFYVDYLSSHPGNHLIARIRLESAPVGDPSSGPVRHEKSAPPEIPRSASSLRACPTVLEIERCPQKNNIDCHLAAAVSHALPPWHKSIGACLRCEENSAHPLDLFLICPLEAWLLLAEESHQQSISVRLS